MTFVAALGNEVLLTCGILLAFQELLLDLLAMDVVCLGTVSSNKFFDYMTTCSCKERVFWVVSNCWPA